MLQAISIFVNSRSQEADTVSHSQGDTLELIQSAADILTADLMDRSSSHWLKTTRYTRKMTDNTERTISWLMDAVHTMMIEFVSDI
jgi:hypothetical protein